VGDDAADGVLNLSSGVGRGHGEGVAAGPALACIGDGAAGLVMVVAVELVAHGGRTAAIAFGHGVAALMLAIGSVAVFDPCDEVFRVSSCVVHR